MEVAIWHKVNATEQGVADFLDCNWGFHDFRIERVSFIPKSDTCEVFLKYDTGKEGVILRFSKLHDLFIRVDEDYLEAWLFGSTLLLQENGAIRWIAADDVTEYELESCTFATWVEADQLIWAVTDGDGQPIEMPAKRLHRVWNDCGKRVEKHFQFEGYCQSIS